MIPDEEPLFPRGHNEPPGLLPVETACQEWREWLREADQGGTTFAARKAEILRSAASAVVRSRETAGAAGDVVKIAKRVRERLNDARKQRVQPYSDVVDGINGATADFWDEVDQAVAGVRDRIDTFLREERERAAQQKAEQAAQEAEMRAAAAAQAPAVAPPPAAPAPIPARPRRIRGDLGSLVLEAERDVLTVVDVRALPDHILNAPSVHEAIVAAVKATRKALGVPAGIKVTTVDETRIK